MDVGGMPLGVRSELLGAEAARNSGSPEAEIDQRQDQPAKDKKAKKTKQPKKRSTHTKQEKRAKKDNKATSE
jgi:hypothetical protein